jgi:hypothetical protein
MPRKTGTRSRRRGETAAQIVREQTKRAACDSTGRTAAKKEKKKKGEFFFAISFPLFHHYAAVTVRCFLRCCQYFARVESSFERTSQYWKGLR